MNFLRRGSVEMVWQVKVGEHVVAKRHPVAKEAI